MERVRNSGNLSTMDIVCCGLFAAMIAIGAFIKIMIPVGAFEVTFSLQFFKPYCNIVDSHTVII